ncbi:MAG: hypothetical protein PHR35_13080 [Kiritimatiellae bacterium]|nr:hypothetical protein [Kiritimatiellia bacterium]
MTVLLATLAVALSAETNRSVDTLYPAATVRLPLRIPSRGLFWSKARYPDQYAGGNVVTTRLSGLAVRDSERFLDVANRAYSREFVTGFSYTNVSGDRPSVEVAYCRKAETFTGRLVARGLKPHFAYQIKLCGDRATDPAGFERIGFLGRWRRLDSRATNYTDYDYASAPDKSVFESYILFDYFVTDDKGSAEKEFYLDSTLHVLFNQPYQGLPGWSDSRPVKVVFTNTDSMLYANPKPLVSPQYVYAQTESGANGQRRPDIGEAFLPAGPYVGRLVLIEESFHGYGDGGSWPTVMDGKVAFEVTGAETAPSPTWRDDLPGRVPFPCTSLAFRNSEVLKLDDCGCVVRSLDNLNAPVLFWTNGWPLVRGRRQVLSFDVRSDGRQALSVLVSADKWLAGAVTYRLPAAGNYEWQRIEVEFDADDRTGCCYLGLVGPAKGAPWELRNLQAATLDAIAR